MSDPNSTGTEPAATVPPAGGHEADQQPVRAPHGAGATGDLS